MAMLGSNQRPPPCKLGQSFPGRYCPIGISRLYKQFLGVPCIVVFLPCPGVSGSGCSTVAASAVTTGRGCALYSGVAPAIVVVAQSQHHPPGTTGHGPIY